MDWKDAHWKELVDRLASRRPVIPIIGPDLLSVQLADGRTLPFPLVLAERMAASLPLQERVRLPGQPSLHEVAVTPRWKGREAEFAADLAEVQEAALAQILSTVLDPARPTPLRRIAEIVDFPLYITTTPDVLFEQVLAAVRGLRYGDVRTFYLRGERGPTGHKASRCDDPLDLPRGWEPPDPPGSRPAALFYLFGRIDTGAHFDITEEQRLETLWRLQSDEYQPEQLMRELQDSHILLLGTRFPDWIGRYFIRLLRGQRLAENSETTEALADLLVVTPGPPSPFVAFLDTFSQNTRLYRAGNPTQFVDELHCRWFNRFKTVVQTSLPDIPSPPSELQEGACFISYRRPDAAAAVALYHALRSVGLPVWLDTDELHGGDRFDEKIRRNVEHAAFFFPVLSSNTRGQGGYFRREWAWALAHDKDFTAITERGYLRPIIIDETPANTFTDIPVEFRKAHIESFPRGQPTPESLARLVAAHQRWAAPAATPRTLLCPDTDRSH